MVSQDPLRRFSLYYVELEAFLTHITNVGLKCNVNRALVSKLAYVMY